MKPGILSFLDSCNPTEQKALKEQLTKLNIEELENLRDTYVVQKPTFEVPHDIQAVPVYPHIPQNKEQAKLYKKAEKRGKQLVRESKVAAFLVAGGQGTRLGYEGPKGQYCVTPIKRKSLFQIFAEQLLAYSEEAGNIIPWYIMTSEANHEVTVEFFRERNYFGYEAEDVFFFKQGMMPAFSMEGNLLLCAKDSFALSPDGHGGCLRALAESGALADMKKRGVEHISYFQVDNPLVHCIDYLFLGLHDLKKSEMSSKTIPKAHALEKVGNFVFADGKVQVIEYSDLPENLAHETNSKGTLRFNAGSIAIHALAVDFVERLTSKESTLKLPWHRAEKKVAYLNEAGELVKPEKPNAVKLEQFIFDALPLAQNALVYETDRKEEFSPVKNAEGNDSPESCRMHQTQRAARWLTEAGVRVPMKDGKLDAVLEIEPLFAVSAQALKSRRLSMKTIKPGSVLYFGINGIEDYSELPIQAPTRTGLREKIKVTVKNVFSKKDSNTTNTQPAGI